MFGDSSLSLDSVISLSELEIYKRDRVYHKAAQDTSNLIDDLKLKHEIH